MRYTLFGLLFLAFPLLAQETISLRNDREGDSFYAGRGTDRAINRAIDDVPGNVILGTFQGILSETEENKLCAYEINDQLKARLKEQSPHFDQFKGAIHYLRSQNEIDDVVVKLLLEAHETQTKKLRLPKQAERLYLPRDKDKVDEMVRAVGTFPSKLKNSCFDEAYQALYRDIKKVDKKVKGHHIEAIFVEAVKKGLIGVETYKSLERARQTEVEQRILGLRSYYQKINSLRTQYPLRDANEKSNFATEKFDKSKLSRRQRLLENYTDLQIILMGNVIKKLRSRLEADKIEILIYDEGAVEETIPLEPMERFRFAIRILRKEMTMLALNTYFAGRTPDYIDLMTAAYETGIIPAVELEEIAGLKEIWNPKKSFWEKAGLWVKSFSSIATLVIPPPYGFLPALGVVVIEATVGKEDNTNTDNTSLF